MTQIKRKLWRCFRVEVPFSSRQTYLPTGSCANTRGNDLCHNLGTVPAVTGSFLTSGLVVFVVEPLQVVLALAELARFFGNVVHAVGW